MTQLQAIFSLAIPRKIRFWPKNRYMRKGKDFTMVRVDFYTELVKRLPKPIDLIDLSKPTLFNRLILREGMKIYG